MWDTNILYHQPPPTLRPSRPTLTAPLFPVPPPGRCLIPPPPLQMVQPNVPFYNYQKERRNRILVDIPLAHEDTSTTRTIGSSCSVQVLKSNLDPNSTPFMPAISTAVSPVFIPADRTTQNIVDNLNSQQIVSLCNSNTATSPLESLASIFGSPLESSSSDPLPSNLAHLLLPLDLDNSSDEAGYKLQSVVRAKYQLPRESVFNYPIHPPPILPLTNHWSRSTRPPLLPTPPNFPPYGPRQLNSDVAPAPLHSLVNGECIMPRPLGVLHRLGSPAFSLTKLEEEQLALDSIDFEFPIWKPDVPKKELESLLSAYPVPQEYLTTRLLSSKLPHYKLSKAHTDLLLFLFYCMHGERSQIVVSNLLFERGWRYHTVDKVWLARWPGVTPEEKTSEWEEGLYQYFDVEAWRRIPGRFRLNYSQLAEKDAVSEDEKLLRSMLSRELPGGRLSKLI